MSEKVARIIMRRDEISYGDAMRKVEETKAEIAQILANTDEDADSPDVYEMVQEVIEDYLGLEPDYMLELLPIM